ncbi:hypothetical protein [Bartonella sp. CL266QHHD]|uniref:hypothetical protein n=1 Tax=Bartonella sp. CL266QHHD TaxID=3243519 RepID=UPI0035CFBA29
MSSCQEHGKWCFEKKEEGERRKGVKEGRMQEGGADACEGVVHAGVSPCWGMCWGVCWGVCVEGVDLLPKSLLFIEFF